MPSVTVDPKASASILGEAVRFTGVTKHYGASVAVAGVDLDIRAGEFLTLLGASGSGKTTTLMMLAGFENPTSGEIFVAEKPITHVPPARRNIGMVFQSYALFPHMTVEQNVTFPLRMRNVSKADSAAAVKRVLEIVGLAHLAERYPRQLSGGQQQRVALARAIVFEPPVLLMDEPLGALDKHLRNHLQVEIRSIQQRLGLTVVYVTHDQEEALTMSDRICVMQNGRIVQLGSPEDLYDRPANTFVANFFGESNLLNARIRRNGQSAVAEVATGKVLPLPDGQMIADGESAHISVRPERIAVLLRGTDPTPTSISLEGTVAEAIFVGDHRRYSVHVDGVGKIAVKQPISASSAAHAPGEKVLLAWPREATRVFLEREAGA